MKQCRRSEEVYVRMFWTSWETLLKIAVVGLGAYAGLVLIQKVSGKRTLSKLNAFDLIVTVALGSVLATAILSPDVSLADGLVAFAVLIGLQLAVTFLSVRSRPIRSAVKASPTRVVRDGEMLAGAMLRERIAADEIRQAVRSAGKATLQGLDVVLETNGELSVVPHVEGGADGMKDVR